MFVKKKYPKKKCDCLMSLDKSIASGKERRKPYRKSKAVDVSCRNHGKCQVCQLDRTYKNEEKKRLAEEELKHFNTSFFP